MESKPPLPKTIVARLKLRNDVDKLIAAAQLQSGNAFDEVGLQQLWVDFNRILQVK